MRIVVLGEIYMGVDEVVVVIAEGSDEDHGDHKNYVLFGSVVYLEGIQSHHTLFSLL
jgi:hypothetical protein